MVRHKLMRQNPNLRFRPRDVKHLLVNNYTERAFFHPNTRQDSGKPPEKGDAWSLAEGYMIYAAASVIVKISAGHKLGELGTGDESSAPKLAGGGREGSAPEGVEVVDGAVAVADEIVGTGGDGGGDVVFGGSCGAVKSGGAVAARG